MKKYSLPLALVGVIGLQACNEQIGAEPIKTAVGAPAPAAESSEQILSYGIAYSLGGRFKQDNIPLDIDTFTQGLTDALAGKEPAVNQETFNTEMQAYQGKIVAKQQVVQEAIANANVAAAATFLSENAKLEGVVVTDSGLQYQIVEAGDGELPRAKDTVEVHYRGTLLDGTEFDSSYTRGQTVSFEVGQVIAGWTEALQLMPVGSKWKLFIPGDLAYGTGGAGDLIGPNATLIFDVELIAIAGSG